MIAQQVTNRGKSGSPSSPAFQPVINKAIVGLRPILRRTGLAAQCFKIGANGVSSLIQQAKTAEVATASCVCVRAPIVVSLPKLRDTPNISQVAPKASIGNSLAQPVVLSPDNRKATCPSKEPPSGTGSSSSPAEISRSQGTQDCKNSCGMASSGGAINRRQ